MDTISLLTQTFAPLGEKHLLDVGCGGGHLARTLLARGARITGVDPLEDAVAAARQNAPNGTFEVACAQALPFRDGEFDGAVFLNSLHHVADDAMVSALSEAARVTVSGGLVVVIEPLAHGSFFAAFRPIDDETEVRARAQNAVAAALSSGQLRMLRSTTFTRSESFTDLDQFIARVTAADPERHAAISRNRTSIDAAFRANAARDAEGRYRLDQPLKADILQVERAS